MSYLRMFLKVGVLGVALGLCVYTIVLLQGDLGGKTMEALGFREHSDNFVAWCQNRVHSMRFADSPEVAIVEHERQWTVDREGQDGEVVQYLALEKWFGEFCQVQAEDSPPAEAMALSLAPLLEVEFINSTKLTIYRVGEDQLQIGERIFRSEPLERGLHRLREIMVHRH